MGFAFACVLLEKHLKGGERVRGVGWRLRQGLPPEYLPCAVHGGYVTWRYLGIYGRWTDDSWWRGCPDRGLR